VANVSNVDFHIFSGSHHEIGIQQGKVCSEQLHETLEKIPSYDFIRLIKPKMLPNSIWLTLAKRRAEKLLKNDIFKYYPKQAQRLSGIAAGAGISLADEFLFQGMELMIGNPTFQLEACSTLALGPNRTAQAETIVGKNFDYLNVLESDQLTCLTKPEEGSATLGCKMTPLAGMLDGMNEYGLTVTYNLAYTREKPECYAPLSMVLQEMLETCKNAEEASNFIAKAKRGGHDAILTLADAAGDIKTVEITSRNSKLKNAENGQAVNTNHYKSIEMKTIEIPSSAVYAGKHIWKEDLGIRIHESSERRQERVSILIENNERIDEEKVISVLRDHGEQNKPSARTICRHDHHVSTIRSVIFFPNRKTIRVLYGKPCQNNYNEYAFS
jgi:predicted choloylglycine hydrolase